MKRVFLKAAAMLAAGVMCAAAFAAEYSVTFDVSKHKVSTAFKAQTKQAKLDYKAGKFILAPFVTAEDITPEALSELLPFELNTLEECFFPDDTNWFDEKTYEHLYGKLSTKNLSPEDAAAVALIRAERKKIYEGFGEPIKSGASFDLNGDGKKEKITYEVKSDDYGMKLKVGKASATVDGFEITDVYALDIGQKQTALLVCSYSENDYSMTSAFFYDGKTLKTDTQRCLSSFENMRYLGDGRFYTYRTNVPVGSVTISSIIDGEISANEGERAQKPIQWAAMNTPNDYNDGNFSLKCAELTGGTVTFKPGEKLAVLTSIPVKMDYSSDDYRVLNEASVAVINEQGKIGLFTTAEFGYCLGEPCTTIGSIPEVYYITTDDGIPYIYAVSQGFVFLP